MYLHCLLICEEFDLGIFIKYEKKNYNIILLNDFDTADYSYRDCPNAGDIIVHMSLSIPCTFTFR